MFNVLVSIAKNEDHYIDEWLSYNLKIGFDRIFVYQNNWRYSGKGFANNSNIEWIQFDGEAKQLFAYNDFIDNRSANVDFAAFFDCDEFLCLKHHVCVRDFFSDYQDKYGIAINWRCFGDNKLSGVVNENYSVLNRFVRCGKNLDRHVKTCLNIPKCKNVFHFVNPHFVDMSLNYDVIYDLDGKPVHGPWNYNCTTNIAQLNHYTCKTFEEFSEKFNRGKADTLISHPQYNYVKSDFYKHNENDIEDLTAKNFYLS